MSGINAWLGQKERWEESNPSNNFDDHDDKAVDYCTVMSRLRSLSVPSNRYEMEFKLCTDNENNGQSLDGVTFAAVLHKDSRVTRLHLADLDPFKQGGYRTLQSMAKADYELTKKIRRLGCECVCEPEPEVTNAKAVAITCVSYRHDNVIVRQCAHPYTADIIL